MLQLEEHVLFVCEGVSNEKMEYLLGVSIIDRLLVSTTEYQTFLFHVSISDGFVLIELCLKSPPI